MCVRVKVRITVRVREVDSVCFRILGFGLVLEIRQGTVRMSARVRVRDRVTVRVRTLTLASDSTQILTLTLTLTLTLASDSTQAP